MQLRDRIFAGTVVAACVVGFFSLDSSTSGLPPVEPESDLFSSGPELPDFTGFSDVQAKKDAFFSFMLPLVEQENQRIEQVREQLLALSGQLDTLSEDQEEWLLNLARHYRVVTSDDLEAVRKSGWPIETLLRRVDKVPPSLALAQAANESAWGTSRFAEQGNNLFGQWCFQEGCGMVPNRRNEGASHEVASFDSPRHSVQRYIHNLNTNLAYKDFRIWRANQRDNKQPLSGEEAAETLTRYSERGGEYIEELQSMIRFNQLSRFDGERQSDAG